VQLVSFEAGRTDAPAIDVGRLDACVADLPALHASNVFAALAWALVLETEGDPSAVERAREALALAERAFGRGAIMVVEPLVALARLTRASHPDEARGYANRAVELAMANHGSAHPQTHRCRRVLDPR
jgi:hypothetical protein